MIKKSISDLSNCEPEPDCRQSVKVRFTGEDIKTTIPIETKTVIFVMVGVIAGGLGALLIRFNQ